MIVWLERFLLGVIMAFGTMLCITGAAEKDPLPLTTGLGLVGLAYMLNMLFNFGEKHE